MTVAEKLRLFFHSKEFKFMEKWIPLSIIIGILSGFGAVIFELTLRMFSNIFLLGIVGFKEPEPGIYAAEYTMAPIDFTRLVIALVLGGLLSGLITWLTAPEAGGEGTDAAIEAYHFKEGHIRGRVPLIKLITSSITIGSGGSAGKEGPIAQIGGGLGSLLVDFLHLSPKDRRMALAIGMGSGIGAIFKAPFGGALLSSELFYISDFEPEVLPPAFISSIVSYAVFAWVFGLEPMFVIGNLQGLLYELNSPLLLFIFGILGLVNGIMGFIYIYTFAAVEHIFKKLPVHQVIKPAIGAFFVAIIGYFAPHILGGGYGWLQLLIFGEEKYFPLYLLFLLPFLKILTTSLTIGSGGSGGVFAPTLIIGGFTGAVVWEIVKMMIPSFDIPMAPFIILGMMSFLGGAGKVPISVILMVSEMTEGYVLFAPSLISTTIAYIVTGDMSIFQSQVYNRSESPAHEESKLGLLRTLLRKIGDENEILLTKKARDVMVRPRVVFSSTERIAKVIDMALKTPYRTFPVVDNNGRFIGLVELQDLLLLPEQRLEMEVCYANLHRIPTVEPTASLRDLVDLMFEYETDRIGVVDADGRLLGLITVKEILKEFAHEKLTTRKIRRGKTSSP